MPPLLALSLAVATAYYGVRLDRILYSQGGPVIDQARRVAMALARLISGASYAEIGRAFGKRQAPSVRRSVRHAQQTPAERQAVGELIQQLMPPT